MSIVAGLVVAAAVAAALMLTTGAIHEIVQYAAGLLTGFCLGRAKR
jgi:hypothetical protein